MAKLFAKLDENNVVMSRILLDEAHAATEAKGIITIATRDNFQF